MAPERELIRRISPFALPVAVAAFATGSLVDGTDAGWSAAAAIALVFANFLAHGWSLALAAEISPVVLYGVGLGGFVVRLAVIAVAIVLLRGTSWFAIEAFLAALVPATVALLVVEMKLLAGRMQADLWAVPAADRQVPR